MDGSGRPPPAVEAPPTVHRSRCASSPLGAARAKRTRGSSTPSSGITGCRSDSQEWSTIARYANFSGRREQSTNSRLYLDIPVGVSLVFARSAAHVMHEAERVDVAFVGRVRLAADFPPVLHVDFGEMGIGRHFGIDPGQVQVAGLVEQLVEDLAAADDAQLAGALAFGNPRPATPPRACPRTAPGRCGSAPGWCAPYAADRFGRLAPSGSACPG